METKKCSECGEVKPLNESYKSPYTKEHRRNQCKECWKKYYQNYFKNPEKVKRKNYLYNKRRYKNGERNPLGTNTKCTCYSGYDFICDNIKIDVKTSSLHFKKTYVNKFRTMNTCKNNNTDIFLCIGYDNRKDLNIKHIWLFPKELGNYRQSINIHDSEKYLQKFKRYEITEKVKYIIKKE